MIAIERLSRKKDPQRSIKLSKENSIPPTPAKSRLNPQLSGRSLERKTYNLQPRRIREVRRRAA